MVGFKRTIRFAKENSVVLMFLVLCLLFMKLSGQSFNLILNEITTRLLRNAVLVLSLLIPVMCGLGLNFSIVLGAMAGQIGLYVVTHYGIGGLPGLLVAGLIGVAFSVVFGYGTGKLYNNTIGQEMITGMILGYFARGVYQLIFLVLLGTLIPMQNSEMMISTGIGLKNTIALDGVKNALGDIVSIKFGWFVLLCAGVLAVYLLVFAVMGTRRDGMNFAKALLVHKKLFISVPALLAVFGLGLLAPTVNKAFFAVNVPLVTVLVILLACLFNTFISRTKLGQDIRTAGQDMAVAKAAGINVGRVRIIAVILSTAIASIGQIIYLQDMGVVTTYSSHDNVGTYAVAALLVGGASINKANIGQAFMGIVMFHILFFTSPLVGKNLFNDSQVGEYFRVFISYGVIAVSLVMYVFKRTMEKKRETETLAGLGQAN